MTHEDFQRARRISRAIQDYLEELNEDGLRSTDLYPMLARKGLVEKDRHNGLHFRRFLKRLKDNDALDLIPQCNFRYSKTEYLEWHFYRIKNEPTFSTKSSESVELNIPKISEQEIDQLISKAKGYVQKLSARPDKEFTLEQQQTRKNYKRAYELWTQKELKLLRRAYEVFSRIDKVAKLLHRQPSAVENKLKEIGLIK